MDSFDGDDFILGLYDHVQFRVDEVSCEVDENQVVSHHKLKVTNLLDKSVIYIDYDEIKLAKGYESRRNINVTSCDEPQDVMIINIDDVIFSVDELRKLPLYQRSNDRDQTVKTYYDRRINCRDMLKRIEHNIPQLELILDGSYANHYKLIFVSKVVPVEYCRDALPLIILRQFNDLLFYNFSVVCYDDIDQLITDMNVTGNFIVVDSINNQRLAKNNYHMIYV